MPKRALHWFITIALVVQFLSLTTGMGSAHATGLWTVSCAGKPMLLPLPGDTDDSSPMGQCLYCCLDSADVVIADNSPVSLKAGGALSLVTVTSAEDNCRIDSCHPARAPPAIR